MLVALMDSRSTAGLAESCARRSEGCRREGWWGGGTTTETKVGFGWTLKRDDEFGGKQEAVQEDESEEQRQPASQ